MRATLVPWMYSIAVALVVTLNFGPVSLYVRRIRLSTRLVIVHDDLETDLHEGVLHGGSESIEEQLLTLLNYAQHCGRDELLNTRVALANLAWRIEHQEQGVDPGLYQYTKTAHDLVSQFLGRPVLLPEAHPVPSKPFISLVGGSRGNTVVDVAAAEHRRIDRVAAGSVLEAKARTSPLRHSSAGH